MLSIAMLPNTKLWNAIMAFFGYFGEELLNVASMLLFYISAFTVPQHENPDLILLTLRLKLQNFVHFRQKAVFQNNVVVCKLCAKQC